MGDIGSLNYFTTNLKPEWNQGNHVMRNVISAFLIILSFSFFTGCDTDSDSGGTGGGGSAEIEAQTSYPPIYISTAPDIAQVDVPYLYNISVVDVDSPPDAITLSANASDTCGGALTDDGDGMGGYTFTPAPAQVNTQCVVGITASDGINQSEQNTTVDIGDDNTAPYFTSNAPTTAAEEVPYTYDIAVADDNVPAQVLVITGSLFDTCGGAVADNGDGTGAYTFTPDENQGGAQCLVGVNVMDSMGADVDQYTLVDVAEDNKAPSFTSTAPTTAAEGALYMYVAGGFDRDIPAQALACSINASDTCAGSLSGCLYTFTPTETQGNTNCILGVRLSDGADFADQNTTVNIAEVNTPPQFNSTAPTGANEGVLYTYAATVSDSDLPAQTLTCSINGSDTCGGGLAGCTYTFTPTEIQGGTGCVVGMTVSDTVTTTDQNSTVYIAEVNSPPEITSVAPTTATEGVLYTYNVTANDIDNPAQTLTCTVTSSDSCGGSFAGCTYTFTPTETQGGGNCIVAVRVEDDGVPILIANQNTTVSVAETNQAPSFTSTAPTTATEAALYTYAAVVSDPDLPAQTLTCSVNGSDTCGGGLAGCTYTFTPTEIQGGNNCTVGLTVSDTVTTTDQNSTVNVAETNQAPSFTSTAPTTATEAALYTYAAVVSDPDMPAQTLTCSVNGSDTCGGGLAGCTYTFTPTETQGGANCTVGLTVSDTVTTTDQNSTVNVSETNQAPSFTSTAPTTATEGVLYTYAAVVSDPDLPAQTLTCSINGSDNCGGGLAGCTYTFTPTEIQGGNNCTVGLTVSDTVTTTDQNSTVSVSETNISPTWSPVPSNITVPTSTAYNANNGHATDNDLPAQTLSCTSTGDDCSFGVTVSGSAAGAVDCNISFAGVAAGETCTLGVQVSDGSGGTITSSIDITIESICVIYVDDSAAGANNGTSWANAYTSIQTAVDNAAVGCYVWVAGGTYKNVPASTSPILTMKADVEIYGGFAGTEASLAERTDFSANASVLDGESTSQNVVVGASNAVLDGFTIINGNSTGTGAGMNNSAVTNLEIANCVFRDNVAFTYGGGIENASSSTPTIINCIFINNTAEEGGGIDNYSSTPSIINCTFNGNDATDLGGGLNNWDSSPTVTNCIFRGNTAVTNGPEIWNQETLVPTVTYCNVQGGYAGATNLDVDPLFVTGTYGDFYLNTTSLCVNAGSDLAVNLDLDDKTTRTDNAADTGTVDLGYHYPIP